MVGHVLQSHPAIPPLEISERFAGFILVSPWVSLDTSGPSWDENSLRDVIDSRAIQPWAELVKAGATQNGRSLTTELSWLEPSKAPTDWWKGTEKIVQHVLITYGEREVLKDSVKLFVERFKEGVKGEMVDVTVLEDKGGIHIGPTLDANRGREPGDVAKIIAGWAFERLGH